eukprot:TRINITY_DN5544_c0_g2_i1.p1 TRINITY_DN5544_c0_g2~~TRINITY_DN5544_c0_g2_i1.p1  ORF type:complete len:705 (+),score=141.82 TRINITY_DN5544_c0_g2_i1:93-2207(+)
MKLVTLATCNLDQWALDFDGNLKRIIASIKIAKEKGATYRLGPELEICGYGCEDHFLEEDTVLHSWKSLAEILKSDITNDILCDFGMPILHKNVRYNCRVFVLNGKVVCIRPKMALAADGNYRENRWFTAWTRQFEFEEHYLPGIIVSITKQDTVPFGDVVIATRDTAIAAETCEELFTPQSPHIALALDGVEIITNGSGSHHQLRKLNTRIDLMRDATNKSGGVYLYSNQQGCDGGRLYFDGCCLIMINGNLVAQGSQFSLLDVEVITATVDLEAVRSQRASFMSRCAQAAIAQKFPRINVDFYLTSHDLALSPSLPIPPKYLLSEEEIGFGPACWLWDYLRRSKLGGYFLPLSGGADSSATATIVGIMTQLVVKECEEGNQQVIEDARRIVGDEKYVPKDARELASRVLFTCYMGSVNSSSETRDRAALVAKEIGATHNNAIIDPITTAFLDTWTKIFPEKTPKFKAFGGTATENLALQNIQARSRMVLSYLMAQLLLWKENRPGSLLVLGSANVDEALRGYMTKYDCSSADVNPIGAVSKMDLKRFLRWAAATRGYPSLVSVVEATPTAELEPITENYTQSDEADMGMTYEELSVFGRLRKIERCGPVSMFQKLVHTWAHLEPEAVAKKVKMFFFYYCINRHKLTTLTPSYHAENYSPDDNRYDLRPFLYNSKWDAQFRVMDELVEEVKKARARKLKQQQH